MCDHGQEGKGAQTEGEGYIFEDREAAAMGEDQSCHTHEAMAKSHSTLEGLHPAGYSCAFATACALWLSEKNHLKKHKKTADARKCENRGKMRD